MYQKIPVKDLKVGMYVVNTGPACSGDPGIYSVEGLITYAEEIAAIVADGYTDVVIDLDKSEVRLTPERKRPESGFQPLLVKDLAAAPQARPRVPMAEELPRAEKALGDILRFAKEFTRDARLGRQIDVGGSATLVESVMDSVSRNSQALLGLCKLRNFDEYTYSHSINVSVLAVVYGTQLGTPRDKLRELGLAGLFHDIGKTAVPEQILNKPNKLTREEFEVMKTHPAKGRAILHRIGGLSEDILDGVLHHHERVNGKGYPNQLTDNQLGLFPKIIGMVDVYDALTSQRCYKKGMLPSKAIALMYGLRGSDFAAEQLDHFIKCLGIYPIGSFVRLDNGLSGFVIENMAQSLLRPKVKLAFDSAMRRIPPEDLDLSQFDTPNIVECLDPATYRVDPASYVLAQ